MPRPQALADSPGEVETKALVLTLPGTIPDEEAETVFNTLSNVEAEAPVLTLRNTLSEVEAETLGGRLFDVEHQALVVAMGHILAEPATQLATHWAMWRPRHSSRRFLIR